MLRGHEGKYAFKERKKSISVKSNQMPLTDQIIMITCAPISELPPNISTWVQCSMRERVVTHSPNHHKLTH